MSRFYVVSDLKHPEQTSIPSYQFLVEAESPSQALSTVVSDRYAVKVATASTVVELMSSGVTVLRAKKKTASDAVEASA